MITRRRLVDVPGFWLVIAAVLIGDAAVTVAFVGRGAEPFAVAILGFALVSIANALRVLHTDESPVERN